MRCKHVIPMKCKVCLAAQVEASVGTVPLYTEYRPTVC